MYSVRFVRSVCKEIQKLPIQHYEHVLEVVKNFCDGDLGDCRKLAGYEDLWRTRKGDTRIIWKKVDDRTILVIKVDARKDVYEGDMDDISQDICLDATSILGIEPTKLSNLPTYELPKRGHPLHQFFFGGYVYSPVLTEEQRKLLSHLHTFSSPSRGVDSLLIQSAPGTGKTICATLLACDLYENYGYHVILILPKNLSRDVQEYERVKHIRQNYGNVDFFIGTLEEWISSKRPELYAQIATREEQKIALEKEAWRVHIGNLNDDDLQLYTSFIYGFDDTVKNYQERIIYREAWQRIAELRKIKKENFCQKLNGKILRVDALEKLTRELSPESQEQRLGTIFIIDEAQDYLLREIKLITTMLERWQTEYRHSTLLWLLGDINQRIQPVDFDWGDLHLNKRYSLRYNYRNTGKILEFANVFHKLAEKLNKGNRELPQASDPEDALEQGEPIKILEVATIDHAKQFLLKLSEKISQSSPQSERFLLRKLASQVYVIFMDLKEEFQNEEQFSNINYLSVADAKGREFDGCIVISSDYQSRPLMELNNWYTAATRPRRYLLVVMTSSEIEAIGREKLQSCQFFDDSQTSIDALVNWIAQSSSVESALQNSNQLISMITAQVPDLYFDTYSVLSLIQADEQKIYETERRLISALKKYDVDFLEQQLKEMESISDVKDQVGLRCLILRALDRSWDAVAEALRIKDHNPQEYSRLIHAIAHDLESKGLPYEAARVRIKVEPLWLRRQNYPFADQVDNDSPLASILCKLAVSKIREKIQSV